MQIGTWFNHHSGSAHGWDFMDRWNDVIRELFFARKLRDGGTQVVERFLQPG